MGNLNFLKQKYNLHNAPEVEQAEKRTKDKTGEKVPQNPEARIQNYLDRFREIIDCEDSHGRGRGMEALKTVLYDKFVIKPEQIPESYFENQRRIAREQGHGDIETTGELREQSTEVIITDQKSSLDNWIDYLSSKDAAYPDWLKYYAFRSVLSLGEHDKEKKKFTKRSKGTAKPFPDLNREALAYVLDAVENKYKKENISMEFQDEEEKKNFDKILQGENFAKLYAWAIEKVTPASKEALLGVQGEWVKYDQNSDHMPLVKSLQGHGTGWCTAGELTAEKQLETGDFYVYYSFNEAGKPTIPRAAIRMQEGQIAEVRGIAHEQNLDPYIGDTVKEKLAEFPDGEQYEKKSEDMKFLTEIENKIKKGKELNKDDLIFFYEIEQNIDGFGYQRDPRIEEIRNARSPEEDALIVFECEPSQIAKNAGEINENIKAYIGKMEPGIFDLISKYNIEHIYTVFPEGEIQKYNIEIGGKNKDQLKKEMKEKNIYITKWANNLLESKDFEVLKKLESVELIRVTIKDIGFPNRATTDEIYQRAEELGLSFCPAEVGPHLRLQYSRKEWILIAMKQITSSDGCPYVFNMDWDGDRMGLGGSGAEPTSRWTADSEFVFCFRSPSRNATERASKLKS